MAFPLYVSYLSFLHFYRMLSLMNKDYQYENCVKYAFHEWLKVAKFAHLDKCSTGIEISRPIF